MKTCPNCKETNAEDARFCEKCGREFDVSPKNCNVFPFIQQIHAHTEI